MADNLITQTISTTDAAVVVGCADNPLVSIEVSGTWAGTLNIETNLDPDNAIWRAAKVFTEAGAAASAAPTANGRWIIQAAGVGQVRARLNPATSGGPTVTLRAGDNETFGIGGTGGGGGGGGAVTVTNPADFVDGWDATQGLTTSAGIITDINGTAQGFRRGNIKQWIAYLARFPASLGSTTAAGSLPVTLSTDGPFVVQTGAVNETAPATDIASSGLNGRLQRIAQNVTTAIASLTTLIAKFPAALVGGRLDVNVGATAVTQPVSGTVTITPSGTQTVSGTVTANAGTGTLAISAASLPLPSTAATDRATAAAPGSVELSDGAAFYTAAKTGQLPTALVSGRLDVNIGAAATLAANSTLQAGTANAGNVGGLTSIIAATLTRPANTTTYTAGREMADTGNNILTLTAIATKSGGSGVITQITASCSSNGATKPQLELWLFDTTQALQASADNNATAFPLTDPQADTHICVIPLTTSYVGDATAGTGNFIMDTGQINEGFLTNGSANLFMRIIVRNAYTPGANSETWKFKVHVQQDL